MAEIKECVMELGQHEMMTRVQVILKEGPAVLLTIVTKVMDLDLHMLQCRERRDRKLDISSWSFTLLLRSSIYWLLSPHFRMMY
jgi:hypothetical protein